jgi:dipeptidyl aminopeptidase/acylaminoacyl peptidase
MRRIPRRLLTGLLAPALAIALAPTQPASAQGTLDDYRRAAGLSERFRGLVTDAADAPRWIGDSHRFWYRKSVPGGHTFLLVDATNPVKRPAFDHTRLAAGLSSALDTTFTATTLPFSQFEFTDGERAIAILYRGDRWRCSLVQYTCAAADDGESDGPREEERMRASPDGRWEAFIQNHNVAVRPAGGGETRVLSHDGSEGSYYSLPSLAWSPDSRHLAVYRVTPGYRRLVHYIESSPADQVQPKQSERVYTKPGDVLDVQQPVLFEAATGRQRVIDNALFPNPYSLSRFEWRTDSRAVTFEYNQRGHRIYRVIEADTGSGMARAVVSEEPETFFYYRNASGNQRDSGKRFRHDVGDGREVIWMSERDGWSHLYLIDGATGNVKHQITKGEWVVRNVEWVDEEKRQIWFRASGMVPGMDPYFLQYYRIDFDGGNLVAFTEADGEHTASFSADRRYYVHLWSRVDQPPVLELRRTEDRAVIAELERADAGELLATGWQPPEVFVAPGRDGETEIWGVIVRPMNFDPNRSYPVIESIYAGPQGSFVPKTFSPQTGMQALAEFGFIVVQMDGMGTANRSKAFHDVAWRNLGDAGFPDRILWHRAVAAKYPWYDIERVGIYGGSAGGQNSLGALLFHPEFYKVAVSSVGCHDNRMDKIWWNELWMGWPLAPHYEASSNVVHAHRLQGRLLLVVGELDTNVDPASTLQVANALIRADKEFDLLFIPGAGHGSGGEYGTRKRNDFFVQHLLGVRPPDWNSGLALSADNGGRGAGDLEDGPEDEAPSFFDYAEDFGWWRN